MEPELDDDRGARALATIRELPEEVAGEPPASTLVDADEGEVAVEEGTTQLLRPRKNLTSSWMTTWPKPGERSIRISMHT
jgi:hypothetical protein